MQPDPIAVPARLDAEGCELLVQEFDRLLRAGLHEVRLDLAHVTFISSAGLGALAAAHRRFSAVGGRLEVTAASEPVLRVMRLTRLDTLVGPRPGAGTAAPQAAAAPADVERVLHGVRLAPLRPPHGAPLPVHAAAFDGVRTAAHAATVRQVGAASFALGLGTPDADDPAPASHAGELVAAAGCIFHRPPAADPRIDYVVAPPGAAAAAALLAGLAWDGLPTGTAGFEAAGGEPAVTLDAMAAALLEAAAAPVIAFVAVGEIHGLVGVELVRPLAEASGVDHPLAGNAASAGRWLSFSREPVHARSTALVVGVAAAAPPADAALAATLRPLAPGGPLGHAHAAVFAHRPIPRAPGALAALVAALAATPPLAVMHLLGDPAPLLGSGRSEFVRGGVWFGPAVAAAREAR